MSDEQEIRLRRVFQTTPRNRPGLYEVNETYFDAIDTSDKAYWLGMMCTDGYISGRCVCLRLKRTDRTHVECFAKTLGFNGPIIDGEAFDKRKNTTTYYSRVHI